MKKIVFLSTMALDANISIIKRLQKFYEVYYIIFCNGNVERLGNIVLNRNIQIASNIENMKILEPFICLDKTYLVKNTNKIQRVSIEIEVHKIIKSINPDVILTDAANLVFILDRFLHKKKTISIVHDPILHSNEKTLQRRLSNYLLVKLARKYILFNENQKQDFIQTYKLKEKTVFSSFLSYYEFLNLYKTDITINKGIFRVLFFGRISKYKGIEYLLEAAEKYILDYSNETKLEIIIAGNGPFYFNIEHYKKYPQIKILNYFISSTELVSLIQSSNIVVCPYTEATQSGVIMSAYTFLKPVMATNVGGIPSMLNNGKTGLIINPKDSTSIYQGLQKIIANKEILDKYSDEIRNIYFNGGDKSWDIAVKNIINCIEA